MTVEQITAIGAVVIAFLSAIFAYRLKVQADEQAAKIQQVLTDQATKKDAREEKLSELERMQDVVEGLDKEVKELRVEVGKLNTSLNAIQGENSASLREIANLKQQISAFVAQVAQLEKDKATLQEQVKKLVETVTTLSETVKKNGEKDAEKKETAK